MNLYDFKAVKADGAAFNMAEVKGKAVLIVNTASQCGLTGQFSGLEELYQKFKAQGFELLGFPCNQFAGQEPNSAQEAQSFCKLHYGVSFPIMAKIEVNGPHADPLFIWLQNAKPFKGFDLKNPMGEKLHTLLSSHDAGYAQRNDIKWNFTKFLLDKNGEILERFEPPVEPKELESAIKAALL